MNLLVDSSAYFNRILSLSRGRAQAYDEKGPWFEADQDLCLMQTVLIGYRLCLFRVNERSEDSYIGPDGLCLFFRV